MKKTLTTILALWLVSASSLAATEPDSTAKKQAHLVSRLYQMTYGPGEQCKSASPAIAAGFQTELARFVKQEPRLIELMTTSPYYARAVQSNAQSPVDSHENLKRLNDQCEGVAELMRAMLASPYWGAVRGEYIELLSR